MSPLQKWVVAVQIVSHLLLCASQDIILSLTRREMNQIVLTCRTSAALQNNHWTFWLENVPAHTELLDRTDLSITVTVEVMVTTEGVYRCSLGNQSSNSLGPFTTDPNYSTKQDVPLYYVGMLHSSVMLLNLIPLPIGNTQQYYSITWTNSTSHVLDNSNKYSQSPDGSLNVLQLDENNSGNYSLKVVVSNPIVNGTNFVFATNQYFIYVQESPRFVDMPTDIIKTDFKTDSSETLHCEVSGFPNVSIQWSHNGVDIQKDDSKYDVVNIKKSNRISSNLTINSLDANDNGNVSCKANIRGCDVNKSYSSCVPSTLSDTHTANVSIISNAFSYTVMVVDGGNLQLKIDLEGNLIPVPVRTYIKYIDQTTTEESEISSSQTNMDLVILLYISNENVPYDRFKIKVALGTETINSNLYKPPTNDRIIDISKDDILCNILPWIAGIIAGVVVIILLVITLIAIIIWFTIKRIKMKNQHEMEMQLISRLSDAEINNIARKYFPRCYNSTEIVADGDDDSSSIVSPPEELNDWILVTDNILKGIRNKNKRRSLMKLLINAVHDEKWLNPSISGD